MSAQDNGDVSVISACDDKHVAKEFAGCTPKKCRQLQVNVDTAKQHIFNILARRRKSLVGTVTPLNNRTVENLTNKSHFKFGAKKDVNPKKNSCKSKPSNVSPGSKLQCHDGKVELPRDSSLVDQQTDSVCNTRSFTSSSSCLKVVSC